MPALITLFLRAIGWSLVPLGWKLVRGLGFAAVTFTGVQLLMTQAKDYAFSQLGSVPASWLQIFGMLQIDVAINIYFSCYIARAVLWGMNKSGDKTGFRWMGGK